MRNGICFYVMMVVVLMVAAGMVVLVIVVGVLCTGSGISGLYRSGWYFGVAWGFCGRGGRRSGTGGGMCCEASLVVCKWEERFLWRFSLMSVEMNELNVGACLFGIVIWADCFVLLEHDFMEKMAGVEVVAEVFVIEIEDVVRAGFVVFRYGCFGNMTGARVVIQVIVGVLVWWGWSVVWERVWEFVVQAIEERVW